MPHAVARTGNVNPSHTPSRRGQQSKRALDRANRATGAPTQHRSKQSQLQTPTTHREQHGNSGRKKQTKAERHMQPGGKRAHGAKATAAKRQDAKASAALAKRTKAAASATPSSTKSATLLRAKKHALNITHKATPPNKATIKAPATPTAKQDRAVRWGATLPSINLKSLPAPVLLALLGLLLLAQGSSAEESSDVPQVNCTLDQLAPLDRYSTNGTSALERIIGNTRSIMDQQTELKALLMDRLVTANSSLTQALEITRTAVAENATGTKVASYNAIAAQVAQIATAISNQTNQTTQHVRDTMALAENRTSDYIGQLKGLCQHPTDFDCSLLDYALAGIESQFTGPGASGAIIVSQIEQMGHSVRTLVASLNATVHGQLFPGPTFEEQFKIIENHLAATMPVLFETAETLFEASQAGLNNKVLPGLIAAKILFRQATELLVQQQNSICSLRSHIKSSEDITQFYKTTSIILGCITMIGVALFMWKNCCRVDNKNRVAPDRGAKGADALPLRDVRQNRQLAWQGEDGQGVLPPIRGREETGLNTPGVDQVPESEV
ncbi:MAG: hypothetical protein O3A01_03320 [bacterium]|nr:hypothetical protein [bacterium]